MEVDKRLNRLTESGICTCDKASEYVNDLKESADKKITKECASKKSKFFKALADVTRLKILENVGLVKDRKEGKWFLYSLFDSHREF